MREIICKKSNRIFSNFFFVSSFSPFRLASFFFFFFDWLKFAKPDYEHSQFQLNFEKQSYAFSKMFHWMNCSLCKPFLLLLVHSGQNPLSNNTSENPFICLVFPYLKCKLTEVDTACFISFWSTMYMCKAMDLFFRSSHFLAGLKQYLLAALSPPRSKSCKSLKASTCCWTFISSKLSS